MSKEIENEKVIKYGPESATRNLANHGITEEIAKGNKKCIKYIGISIGIVLIIALIIVIIIISGGKSPTPPIEPTTARTSPSPSSTPPTSATASSSSTDSVGEAYGAPSKTTNTLRNNYDHYIGLSLQL